MTQEQKAKAYDGAFNRAKSWYTDAQIDFKKSLETLFPELKCDDEKIRKEIIKCVKNYGPSSANPQLFKNMLAWLEKQGESKSAGKMQVSEKLYEHIRNTCACIDDALSSETLADVKDYLSQANYDAQSAFDMIEKQGEQKVPVNDFKAKDWYVSKVDGKIRNIYHSIDKVEPKFHEGDWVIDKQGFVYQIANVVENVTNHTYGYDIVGGGYFNDNNEDVRLWTIQDAKDGDVLASELCDSIILFRGIKDNNVDFYCDYDFSKIDIPGDRFSINDGQHYGDVEDSKDFHPATKEQRDTLLKAMADAGWEFDFEKKELKKIDEEINGEDYGIDGLWHAQRILEKTLGEVEDYQSDDGILDHKAAITAVKKLYKQKPAEWSEEDERRINRISDFIWKNRKGDTDEIYQQEQDVNWLKSLRPQKQWKPSDEQLYYLHWIANIKLGDSVVEQEVSKHLNELYNDLKKL